MALRSRKEERERLFEEQLAWDVGDIAAWREEAARVYEVLEPVRDSLEPMMLSEHVARYQR